MQAAGQHKSTTWGKVVAILIVAGAITLFAYSLGRASRHPSTDDATIDADVVHVSAAVGGRIAEIAVTENAQVRRGDLLFRIDAVPYRAAVAQAEADLALAQAALATQERAVATQRSGASIAVEQVRRAGTNQALAARTVERLRPLVQVGYVSRQQFDQAEVALRDATTSLDQARKQQAAALTAIDTVAGASAAVQAREAALVIARRALEDTAVAAPHDGRVTGLSVLPGERVLPSQSLFTLIATEQWQAVGNFREGTLKRIDIGSCATVYSLIDRAQPIRGAVESIGAGVLDTDRINVPRALPYVEKSVNWVRVAQRFPVRVRLASPPESLMRLGASAIIEIGHGAACR